MLNGTGRGLVTLSSHITNRQLIPNWGRDKQGLAEPSRTAQENIVAKVNHVPDVLGLIYVEVFTLHYFLVCLYADRQSLQLFLFHTLLLCIVLLPTKLGKNNDFSKRRTEK